LHASERKSVHGITGDAVEHRPRGDVDEHVRDGRQSVREHVSPFGDL